MGLLAASSVRGFVPKCPTETFETIAADAKSAQLPAISPAKSSEVAILRILAVITNLAILDAHYVPSVTLFTDRR